jgi:LacI family transcriptional regulator
MTPVVSHPVITPWGLARAASEKAILSVESLQSYQQSRYSLPCMAEAQVPPAFEDRDSLRPGSPRIQDVARRAGVAIGTVSNVLNNPDLVTEQTRLKVEAAIAELGFVRNSAARALAARRTDTVGLVLTNIGNSLFVDIARGAESATGQAQLKILLANSDSDVVKQNSYLELFDEARVAGVILAPMDSPLDSALTVQRHGRPIILVNAPEEESRLCSVMVNEELGGNLAASHLLDQGARRLVYLAGFPELHAIRRRLTGIEKAVAAAGASLRVIEAPNLTTGPGRELGHQVLQSDSVDGVVCPSDPLAIGVIQAATDLGIAVPDELLVVGYDDDHFASESSIPVSTIGQPGRRMGELAVELLLEEIREPADHTHRTKVLDPHLIARRSSLR